MRRSSSCGSCEFGRIGQAGNPLITLAKTRLWGYLPLYLKHAVYDGLIAPVEQGCAAMGFDAERAFPEPDGMDEYGREQGQRAPQTEEEDEVETPAQQIGLAPSVERHA